jgi:hypothetical protein
MNRLSMFACITSLVAAGADQSQAQSNVPQPRAAQGVPKGEPAAATSDHPEARTDEEGEQPWPDFSWPESLDVKPVRTEKAASWTCDHYAAFLVETREWTPDESETIVRVYPANAKGKCGRRGSRPLLTWKSGDPCSAALILPGHLMLDCGTSSARSIEIVRLSDEKTLLHETCYGTSRTEDSLTCHQAAPEKHACAGNEGDAYRGYDPVLELRFDARKETVTRTVVPFCMYRE